MIAFDGEGNAMTGFTPLPSLAGGLMIGGAASLLLLGNGRIAGISGIAAGSVVERGAERAWRLFFLGGLALGGVLLLLARPESFEASAAAPSASIALAGLAVGVGTRVSGGCTSGHGVCGVARLSKRSVVATLVFIAAGAVAVFVSRHVLGGAA